MFYQELLTRFVQMSKKVFGDNLTGIYLHGSAAMGCFNPKKSDLDMILVVENYVTDNEKLCFMNEVVQFNEEAPAKGIELSIVKKEFCNPFEYPTPYELHFSLTHLQWFKSKPKEYVEKMNGTDKDLAAHFTIIKSYGKVLYGAPIETVFGEVSKEAYIDSIWFDIENAVEDILTSPMYIILNLCRVLAYLSDNLILSKKDGAEWGIKKLPKRFCSLIKAALNSYESDKEINISSQMAETFAEYMLAEIKERCKVYGTEFK